MSVKNMKIGAPIEYGYLGAKRRMDLILNHLDRKLRGLRCEVLQMDAANLSFENNTFDAICSIETLEHVPKQKKSIGRDA